MANTIIQQYHQGDVHSDNIYSSLQLQCRDGDFCVSVAVEENQSAGAVTVTIVALAASRTEIESYLPRGNRPRRICSNGHIPRTCIDRILVLMDSVSLSFDTRSVDDSQDGKKSATQKRKLAEGSPAQARAKRNRYISIAW